MGLAFIVPGALEQLTGGYLFDRRVVAALRAAGRAVTVHELAGRFPLVDAEALAAGRAALAGLADGSLAVIDGLALPGFAEGFDATTKRLRLVGFVHHALALETGLSAEKRERLERIESRMLPRLKGVLCPSHVTAAHLETLGVARERIAVTPPGTAKPAGPRPPQPDGPLSLLAVGTLTPRKGHRLLVEALAPLADRPWRLLCIGSLTRNPATTAALTAAIDRHGLAERVCLAGEWPQEGIEVAYAAADLFVLPSYHEGYGMAFAEALAHGVPIVATRAGAIPETVPASAGLLVPPGDREALTRALALALDDAGLRARLAQGAAAAGARLPDWPDATERWIAALDRLAA